MLQEWHFVLQDVSVALGFWFFVINEKNKLSDKKKVYYTLHILFSKRILKQFT